MQKRIFNVLLVASPYDAFMMEEDGRIEEQLYFEYVALNLSSPPRVTRVSDTDSALASMREKHYDLVIMMPGGEISETFSGARRIKEIRRSLPVVVLTPFSKEVSRVLENMDLSGVDYVFSWLGNVDLLLAIIKLLEDRMNADRDINEVGVQMIMLVEDSVRFYSSVLPHIYKKLLKQSREAATEALNEHEQMLRMRGRPKVLMARDYDEAMLLYERYGDNLLGVISDVSFRSGGVKDQKAGLRLARFLRERDPFLPIIIESSEMANAVPAAELGCTFLDKNSKKLPVDLGAAMREKFRFGDFVMHDPMTGRETIRLRSLKDLQYHIFDIPSEALLHYASQNDISRWLYSRALFPLANVIKRHRFYTVEEVPAVRRLFFDLIVKYRRMKNRGVVAVFRKDRFDHYSNFARIGDGSLGGKGRGLAFIDSIIKKHPECDAFDGIQITIPRTVVLCTDIFDEFMASNNLYPVALSDIPDAEILARFLEAKLPERLNDDLLALFDVVDRPLAVRSSSLLEDSHYQPFAGIYATYMIPKHPDPAGMLEMVSGAIKGVYASVFYRDSKAYMTATSNVIDQEKMAVILQEVVGSEYCGNLWLPSFSGVGRSVNYYPTGREKAEEGVAEVAVGLGKYIVDGGRGLRFSPRNPASALQTSELKLALRDTQRRFYALDTSHRPGTFLPDDSFNLLNEPVQKLASTGALKFIASTYDVNDGMLRDSDFGQGRRVVTFNNMLKHDAFPLARAVDFMLTNGQAEMCRPVEIEFAGMVEPSPANGVKGHIYWLQIRPIVDRKELIDPHLLELPDDDLIIRSDTALGHGNIDNVRHIVYVRPGNFSSLNNRAVAAEIDRINGEFTARSEGYVLIGPGRWGSSDEALGIPVRWPQIASARLIVESSLPGYRIEPSQGTHFFQNLTSFGVGYFTVDQVAGRGLFDSGWLDSQPAVYESEAVRIVCFDTPLAIGIDGIHGQGVVAKPLMPKSDNDNLKDIEP
ncbi:MAG: phosphoenolpyruvate synthase [Clostridium sp.]|nr:phosphoenolpyruvate synthase [Clostridium sp.]